MDRERENEMAWRAQLACGVLVGKNSDGEATLSLLDLDEKMPPERAVTLAKLQCRYVGLLTIRHGVVDGLPVACDPATLHALWSAVVPFTAYAKAKLAPPEAKGDSVEWLERLVRL
jgi:hypothetical protein